MVDMPDNLEGEFLRRQCFTTTQKPNPQHSTLLSGLFNHQQKHVVFADRYPAREAAVSNLQTFGGARAAVGAPREVRDLLAREVLRRSDLQILAVNVVDAMPDLENLQFIIAVRNIPKVD
jgi:hypothetical protein